MAVAKPDEAEAELLDGVFEQVRERQPAEQAPLCLEFVRQYYHWVPAEDLTHRNTADLYGAAVAHFNFTLARGQGETKVRVYNPELDQDGWTSPHTALEIVCDDMPFIVDSLTMALSRLGYGTHLLIHPVIRVVRDAGGHLLELAADETGERESVTHIEFDRELDPERLSVVHDEITATLRDVRAAVEDWPAMRARAEALIEVLGQTPESAGAQQVAESQEFLRWLTESHFTFLGYRDYELTVPRAKGPATLTPVGDSGLGILRGEPRNPPTVLEGKARALALDPQRLLVLTKANSKATVHRPAYLDYVGVKRYDAKGNVTGESRLLGLYTTAAYKESPLEIPLIRDKVTYVLDQARFPSDSHDHKALTEICESYPRDAMFSVNRDELLRIAIGILGLGERQRLRLFAHADLLDRFVECVVCMPRDRFNTASRERAAEILVEAYNGSHYDWSLQLTESTVTRIHIIVHTPHGIPQDLQELELERKIVEAIRLWSDDLRNALIDEQGEQQGRATFRQFKDAFPPTYRSDWHPHSAVADIASLEELVRRHEPVLQLYRPDDAPAGTLRAKLFSATAIELSAILPTLENLGARVIDEHPYEVTPADSSPLWIYDLGMRCSVEDIDAVHPLFEQAFLGVWRGELEDNGLGELVLLAGLDTRALRVVQAISKYLRQAGIPFSDRYAERTLVAHPEIVKLMVELFAARHDPTLDGSDFAGLARHATELESTVLAAIDQVQSLDEDRILRAFLSIVQAVIRTNHYTRDPATGNHRSYLSFKLDSSKVPLLPLPRPRYEIFVYSPTVEGVHLRGGAVARGGLRWSDRPEDFRTEILGLMKAQMVKNALIVPVGSKGGFVVKRPPAGGDREAIQANAIECYKTFLAGLLDITDNIVDGEVVPPADVVRHDSDDPYLVVAADKGTASFSDIANSVSADYGFWLGDAFASGGSVGYDHKEMGITARGAWESVTRHFRELGVDIQTADFTVVGIGDMAGDVFGNGMLLSEHTKLVAAFNHAHIFLDPDPDPAVSFAERKRLFELPRSAWSDYNAKAISEGGGVFSRSAKQVRLSPQIRAVLAIEETTMSPAALITCILKAPIDLLWNGGIGTYVKATTESHADVGDKANDALRVNGAELRCKVVGEGGNLGLTQSGRIEYALAGGAINTDAIDNVAGVNTSDHEVNIKILLDARVAAGELTPSQRNELLAEMTGGVAERVIYACHTQTQALSVSVYQAPSMLEVHWRLIRRLERDGGLNREIEFLPSNQEIASRRRAKIGMTSPELSVLMAYCKIYLNRELLHSDLPEDPYLADDLERYFPDPLPERYAAQMRDHRLRREIIATVVANQMVDRAGLTAAFRLEEETGAPAQLIARGYAVARDVFGMRQFWAEVEGLDNLVPAQVQTSMLIEGRKLVERATRWLVRAKPSGIDIAELVTRYEAGAQMLTAAVPGVLDANDRAAYDQRQSELLAAGVPQALADRVAGMAALLPTLDIVEVAALTGRDLETVMHASFEIGARLQLSWLRDRILDLPRGDRWQALARAALRDDLASLVAELSSEVLESGGADDGAAELIAAWEASRGNAVERCLGVLSDIRASQTYDTTTLPVALRELRNLVVAGG
jgi:glutamate dehydrogenase